METKQLDEMEYAFNEIKEMRFPVVNIRRTANLAAAPINIFGMAMGLFMLSCPMMSWCTYDSATLATAQIFGGLCEYIIGIYDWYQGKSVLCFSDFLFGFLHLTIYYSVGLAKYEITRSTVNDGTYLQGTFFVLFLVALLGLFLATLYKGIMYKVNYGLLILATVFVIVWQYRDVVWARKTAGYFIFFSSLALWFTGLARLLNDVFQRELVSIVNPQI